MQLDLFLAAVAVGCGVIVGFTLGLVGGGGSVLAVPLLLYVVGMPDPHQAIGTSALSVAVNAFANLVPHARAAPRVRWRPGADFRRRRFGWCPDWLIDRKAVMQTGTSC